MNVLKTRSGKKDSRKQPLEGWTPRVSFSGMISLFSSLFLVLMLPGCGGGPNVSQATGHGILLATPQGLFNIAFNSSGSNALTANTPVITGSITAMVEVPNASYPINGPMLVTYNGTALTAYAITGGVPQGAGTTISMSACATSITSITSLSVTPDGKYLLASSSSSEVLGVITLATGYSCSQSQSLVDYPTSVSVECLQLNQPCQIFLTLSTNTPPTALTSPGVISWTEGTSPGTVTVLTSLTPFASSAIFNNETSYFYALVTASNNSSVYNVSGVSVLTSGSKYDTNVSYGNVSFSSPCLDPLGQTLYTPTSNGSVYTSSVSSSGSIGSPNQIWSLASNPSGITISPIYACVAY